MPREVATAGWKAVLRLQDDIYAPQLNLRKLEGYDDVWRLVVKKDYRLVYSFDGNNIYLLRLFRPPQGHLPTRHTLEMIAED